MTRLYNVKGVHQQQLYLEIGVNCTSVNFDPRNTIRPGPKMISLVALDPDNGDVVLSNGDSIYITFNTATDQPANKAVSQASISSYFFFFYDFIFTPQVISTLTKYLVPHILDCGYPALFLQLTFKM